MGFLETNSGIPRWRHRSIDSLEVGATNELDPISYTDVNCHIHTTFELWSSCSKSVSYSSLQARSHGGGLGSFANHNIRIDQEAGQKKIWRVCTTRRFGIYAVSEKNVTPFILWYIVRYIGAGTGVAGGATPQEELLPPTKLLEEQLVHPSAPIFSCNLQLKVTLYKKLSYRRETARQLPTWRGLTPPVHSPSPLWLHLCVWLNPKATTYVCQACRP